MTASQKHLYEIAKKLLIFSGKKGNLTAVEKKKIVPQLEKIFSQIKSDDSNLSKQLQKFITDILGDIENNSPIDIDEINEDIYIENFLLAESFVYQYNSLLTHSLYSQIIINTQNNNQKEVLYLLIKQVSFIKKTLKNINISKASKLLLIVNIFQISSVGEHYSELYRFALENNDIQSAKILLEIITLIKKLHADIHKAGLECLETGSIKTTYMMCDIKNNKLSFSRIIVASEGDIRREYINVLFEKFGL